MPSYGIEMFEGNHLFINNRWQIQYMHSFGFCEFLIMHLILHTCVLRYGYWKMFEYFECPSNIGSASIKKKPYMQ